MTSCINLCVPYALKDKVKEKHPIKWNTELKTWYYEGELPKELDKYIETYVDIEYSEKDELKTMLPTLSFDKEKKQWRCGKKDADKLLRFRQGEDI